MYSENADYEAARQELYSLLQEGLDDVAAGRTLPWNEAFEELRQRYHLSDSGD